MVWFKIDDGWHSHPKRIKTGVDIEGMAAQGLWASAGSWSAKNLTDGFISFEVLQGLAYKTSARALKKLVDRLVFSGLFEPVEKAAEAGWILHDWNDWNPTRAEEQAKSEKKSMGGALGNHRRWHEGKGKTDPRCDYCPRVPPKDVDRGASGRTNGATGPPGEPSVQRSVLPSVDRSDKRNGSDNGAIPPTRPDPTRVSSKSKSGSRDLGVSLTRNNLIKADESEIPYRQRTRKVWCNDHGSPDDRECVGCKVQHGDVAYHAKMRRAERAEK